MAPLTQLYKQYNSLNNVDLKQQNQKLTRSSQSQTKLPEVTNLIEEDVEETEIDEPDRSIPKIAALSGVEKSVATLKAEIEWANPRNTDKASKNVFQSTNASSQILDSLKSLECSKKPDFNGLKFF